MATFAAVPSVLKGFLAALAAAALALAAAAAGSPRIRAALCAAATFCSNPFADAARAAAVPVAPTSPPVEPTKTLSNAAGASASSVSSSAKLTDEELIERATATYRANLK